MTNASVYIHIPFCRSKCVYCDFASFAGMDHLMEPYISSLVTEIGHAHPMTADTLYIGGGTPSHLPASLLENVMGAFNNKFRLADGAEMTIEANPHSASREMLETAKKLGMNRLSIGIQSFNDRLLKTLGRPHTANDAVDTIAQARSAGFANISLDLIFGVPGQSAADLIADLEKAVALSPEHLSVYQLTLEEGTPLEEMVEKGKVMMPDDDEQLAMYESTVDFLKKAGYRQYEISNFAKPGKECRHNLAYWMGDEFAGFGSGAHSFTEGVRYANPDDPEDYIRDVTVGGESGVEILTDDKDKIIDFLLMRLRLVDKALKFEEINSKFEIIFEEVYNSALKNIEKHGFATISNSGFQLTSKGLVFLDSLLLEFEKV
ncbi:MAG: radical SAM family heme chaperone HemW [Nitrospinae bacterium]|nr:radical SAM family heme chaperone HemW [Nitrospinota bacterium]